MSRIAIAKPSAGTVRTGAISRLAKPGFGMRTTTQPTTTTKSTTNENSVRGAAQVSHMQRKTMLRRLNGGENKFASADRGVTQTEMKPPSLATMPNVRAVSVDAKMNGAEHPPLDVTRPICSKGADIQSETIVVASPLTRSGTFVCEASDETQTKLLSLTHNVNTPTVPVTVASESVNQMAQKDRTYKRSLSPIYGELMNMAKRKSMQMPNQTGAHSSIGPSLISTPHGNSQQSIPSFATRTTLSNITELDNSIAFMDRSHHVMCSTGRLDDATRTLHANNESSGKIPQNLTNLLYVTDAGAIDGLQCDSDGAMIGAVGAMENRDGEEEDAIADEEIVLVEASRTHSGK